MYGERKVFNKIIGISEDDTLIVLETAFEYSDSFKGCTGFEMAPLTQEEIDTLNEDDNVSDYCEELWRDAVNGGNYYKGLEDFIDEYKSEMDGLYPGDDDSFRYLTEKLVSELSENNKKDIEEVFGEYETWSCRSCGRIFDRIKFKKVFDNELLSMIKEVEK